MRTPFPLGLQTPNPKRSTLDPQPSAPTHKPSTLIQVLYKEYHQNCAPGAPYCNNTIYFLLGCAITFSGVLTPHPSPITYHTLPITPHPQLL